MESHFLRLPAELRVHIYNYLLPTTTRVSTKHENGLVWLCVQNHEHRLPATPTASYKHDYGIVWQRGCTALLAVNRLISEECLELLYGHNTFVVEIGYERIEFRFRWFLSKPTLFPNRAYSFLDHFSQRNLQRIKKYLVHVEMVDSYTGMIKYNCGGPGLQAGLREQLRRLVEVLRCAGELSKVDVCFVDKQKNAQATQHVLEPLLLLRGVQKAVVSGVTPDYAEYLQRKMIENGDRPVVSHRPRIPFMPAGQRRSAPPLL